MADGLNRVMLFGNLGADPELRFTQAGQAVLNLRLATTESYLDKDKVRQERTEWHSVAVWGRRGEALAKILTKGSSVFIEGSLRTSSYEKDGQKFYRTEIVAKEVLLAGGKRGGDNGGSTDEGAGDQTGAPAGAPVGAPAGGGGSGGGYNRGGGASGGSAPSAGDFEVAFGRDKGKRISAVADLSWLRGVLERDLADRSKEKFHQKARGQLAAIDAELARRGGGGGAPRGGNGGGRPAPAAAPAPTEDDYSGGGGGYSGGASDDDDIPFASSAFYHEPTLWFAHGPVTP
jgi:single-strand DNA-binding protein